MRKRMAGMLVSGATAAASLVLATSAMAAPPTVVKLSNTVAPAATSTPSIGAVPTGNQIDFQVDLALADPTGAAAFTQAVSDPSSASYEQYLTPAVWESRFSPTQATVAKVQAFLASSGFAVADVSDDRMVIDASGSVARIEKVFGTQLSYHTVQGHKLVLNDTDLSVPSDVAGVIAGVSGISQSVATPDDITGSATPTATPGAQPPAGFRNAQPCSTYWGQQLAASFPTVPGGYPSDPPYSPCGYTPPQIRGAYGLTDANDGSGQTVAILDAYAAPTIFADAHEYASLNDPTNPLRAGQFSQLVAPTFDHGPKCGGQNGWWGEETLDVEAVHTTAPGANILYAGAENCFTNSLNDMLHKIIDKHLAEVITNSYADVAGDLLDSAGDRASTDEILQMAAGTGVSVTFSSGDDGDDYDQVGQVSPEYPASSPYATAIGGTSLEVGSQNERLAEYGWSTGKSNYCNNDLVAAGGCAKKALGTWSPVSYDYGAGGGASYRYIQPYYQAGVVPTSMSEENSSTPMRVVPDVAMDADPTTGLLVGETQTFPDGTYYDQYRIGGTSLSSPLFAGVVARADEASGTSAGFLNPKLYALAGNANALDDITPPASPLDTIRSDYLDGVDASGGILYSARTLNYTGTETYCLNAMCTKSTTQPTTLDTAPGYDNLTGVGTPGAGFVTALAAR